MEKKRYDREDRDRLLREASAAELIRALADRAVWAGLSREEGLVRLTLYFRGS